MQRKERKVVQSKNGWHAIHWQDWILQSFMMVCLIFHTAIIINRKNWRITIKLHFENFATPYLPLFVFVRFSVTPTTLLNEIIFWMTPYQFFYFLFRISFYISRYHFFYNFLELHSTWPEKDFCSRFSFLNRFTQTPTPLIAKIC